MEPLRAGGQPTMLTLVTDADGRFYYDWAIWGEPEVEVSR